MRPGPLRWARLLVLIAGAAALLAACGGEDAGNREPDAAPGPAVAFFMGGIAEIDKTVCAAKTERRRGTNVVTVRDHERHYPSSVVRYEDGRESEAREIARRLSIARVAPMDAVTPTLFPDTDVAVIVGADYRCR